MTEPSAAQVDAALTLWAASTQGDRTDVPADVSAAITWAVLRVSALGLEVERLREARAGLSATIRAALTVAAANEQPDWSLGRCLRERHDTVMNAVCREFEEWL